MEAGKQMKKARFETVGVGLDYNSAKKSAPRIVASEKGKNVSQMIRIARRYGLAVHKDDSLAESLSMLELESEVPSSMYGEIAELLVRYDLD